MTTGGWIFMIVSVGFVVGLTGYCFYRVLFHPDHLAEPPAGFGP